MNPAQLSKYAMAFVCALLHPFFAPLVHGEEILYASHFEDEIHDLRGWKLQEGSQGATLTIRRLEEGETSHPAALAIETSEHQQSLRIAQSDNLFFLQPGVPYELRAMLRLPMLETGPKGRIRIFITDARWTWSSPPLELKVSDAAWHTLCVPFSPPEGQAKGAFRIRIEIINSQLAAEIAELAVVETKKPSLP